MNSKFVSVIKYIGICLQKSVLFSFLEKAVKFVSVIKYIVKQID